MKNTLKKFRRQNHRFQLLFVGDLWAPLFTPVFAASSPTSSFSESHLFSFFFPSPADSWWICQLWHVFYWLTRMFLDPWSLTLILTRIPSWYIVSFIAQCWFLCKSNCAKNAGSQFMWQFHPPKIKLAPRLHNAHNLPSLKIISQLYLQYNTIIQLSYMNNSYFLLKGINWAKSCNTHQYI